MIDLYYWTTPNGHKITIFLEETGVEHRILPINIGKGEQFAADFLQIAPNNRIPAIGPSPPICQNSHWMVSVRPRRSGAMNCPVLSAR